MYIPNRPAYVCKKTVCVVYYMYSCIHVCMNLLYGRIIHYTWYYWEIEENKREKFLVLIEWAQLNR